MKIEPVQPQPTFEGYKSPLKSHFVKGDMPKVKYGFYGDILTIENVSIDHLKAVSKGGKTELKNIVLSSKRNNQLKGNDHLKKHIDLKSAGRYLQQFIGIKFPDFDGNKYIKLVLQQISRLMGE